MSSSNCFKTILIHTLLALAICPDYHDCLIITSVLAGDKKFKTVSFHTKLLKPLTFEKEMPLTEFRRHRTLRPPKFDIDINIPIKLPLEDEYAKEEYRKPVESDVFFQTTEIKEPVYAQAPSYQSSAQYQKDLAYASTGVNNEMVAKNRQPPASQSTGKQPFMQPMPSEPHQLQSKSLARSDDDLHQQGLAADSSNVYQASNRAYNQGQQQNYNTINKNYKDYSQEFVPGGFVNLQLNGPTGGPKMTYEDYDREKWAQQLSQAPGAMPYPILNYQQLQNFYGGLGTFTNGLPENRYAPTSLLDKLKSGFDSISSKFHLG